MTIHPGHCIDTPRIPWQDLPPTRALSLWQPWASLCFTSNPCYKEHETRHWSTEYRGPLVIQVTQKLVTDLDPELLEILSDEFGGHWARDLPRGRMLGIVQLTGCYRTEDLEVGPIERLTGNWASGRYAFKLAEPRLFIDPPKVPGRQNFFTWSPRPTKGELL